MAVQAQHPSNVFMADLRNRARAAPLTRDNRSYVASASGVPISLADGNFQLQPNMNAAAAVNLFPVYAPVAGLNFGQQQVLNGTVFSDPESELTCNISGSRKRAREEDILLTQQRQQISQQHLTLLSISEFQQKNAAAVPVSVPGPVTVPQSVSTGLQLAYDDSRLNQPPTSTSARNTNGPALISIFADADDMTAQLQQQQEEIDQIVKLHSEKIRMALEEKRQRHWRALLATLEEGILRKLNGKEAELEKLSRKNAELEERVKHLIMEAQIWQNMAKNNEAMANTLRSNLEQVVAQTREQSKEGHGDSEAEDAQSCCHDGNAADVHSRTIRENRELKEQRTCRVCKINYSCILLLPCRHLCLCKDCERSLETCPLCKSVKKASIQVYMS